MKRRSALKNITVGVGVTVSTGTFFSMLHACKAKPTVNWVPEFFTIPEARILEELAEIILPKTESPGAKEAGVGPFIDMMVKNVFLPTQRIFYRTGLYEFMGGDLVVRKLPNLSTSQLQEKLDGAFNGLNQDSYIEMLDKVDNPDFNLESASADETLYAFLISLKRLVISGYFSSELIGEVYLNYDPIPGLYRGCVPVSEIGVAWALE